MNWPLLQNSLLVSGGATVLATGFGFLSAVWLRGVGPVWRIRLLVMAVVALVLPPFLVTNCWLHFLGLTGVWRKWLPLNIYSLGGTAWILALLTWPVSLITTLSAWQRLERSQLESDPFLTGGALVRWVLWPMARVSLGQAAVLTFVLTLNNFAVPAILQVKVFPAEIWVRFSTNFDTAGALALSWPLLFAPMLLLLFLRRTEISWLQEHSEAAPRLFRQQMGRFWFWGCAAFGTSVLLLSVGLPLVQIMAVKRTWTELPGVIQATPGVIRNSFAFAALTASACVGIAIPGRILHRPGLRLLLWLPLLAPGIILGIVLITLFNRPIFQGIYHSAAIVVIAWTIRYLALGWNGVALAFEGIDPNLTDAARLDGASGWSMLRYVQWPQIGPKAFAAWYLTYLLCLWDVETLILIYPPGGETLALRIFNLLHYGHNAQVNALCLLLLALAVAPLALGRIIRLWSSSLCHWFLPLLAVLFLSLSKASAAEPSIDPKELPRTPPTEPDQALSTFKVRPGFHLELAAAEPLVMSPVAMSFDENGRLFVVEMRDYSERRPERLGRIRMLEDTDGDGRFDKSTVYAENLPWPTAVFCYGGGVFVGATPDIIFFKDTDGDGKADTREVVFTGFASESAPYQTNRLNVQAMLNSFNWGLDNRIHGVTSSSGGTVTSLRHPNAKPIELRGHDFSIDPRDMSITAEAGGGQHGMSFDDQGRRFTCQNSDHIRLYMYEERYGLRNPVYSMPPAWVSIAADGAAAEVYRTSPDEPWRVIRTKWRVAGQVSGPVEGGGRPSGYFTSATGTTIYRGDAFPPDTRGDAFIADCGSNLIHRKKLKPDGVSLIARRAPDEEKTEFITSKDIWFRPVQFANAPDGTLYIADMYREVIEHPWSIPLSIKKYLDLNSGNDRGRIYRIVPDGFKQPRLPQLGKATSQELVATLEHSNGWHRDTATRLIYERQDAKAIPALRQLCENSKSPLARLHALYALDGLMALDSGALLKSLADADERVRRHAVRLSEKVLQSKHEDSGLVQEKVLSLSSDPSEQVRYQTAFTLGEIRDPGKIKALSEIVRRDGQDKWVQAAVLSSLAEGADQLFAILTSGSALAGASGVQDFLPQLALLIGARSNSNEVAQVINFSTRTTDSGLGLSLLRSVGAGLQRAGSSLEKSGADLADIFSRSQELAKDTGASESARIQAIQLLGQASFQQARPVLTSILGLDQPQTVQLAAVNALGHFNQPDVGTELIGHWPALTPRLRSDTLAVLLARPERVAALLNALEDGSIRKADLSSTQIKFLCSHRDQRIRQRALKLLGNSPSGGRDEVVKALSTALDLTGNAAHGKSIYLERCSSCHRVGSDGYAVGPDLVTVKTSGKEKILVSILDPNREVQPAYLGYLIETKDEQSLVGVIANETTTSITLREAFARETIVPRSTVKTIQSLGQSLMPEGLESGLSSQAVADLLEFITNAEAPASR